MVINYYMKRLVAFGCSSTIGQGLPDVDIYSPFQVSELSWPVVLSKLFNVECENTARPGNSNKKILHDIVTFEYEEGDKVFVLWTMPIRHSIVRSKYTTDNMTPSHERDAEYYTKYYDEYDHKFMDTLYKNHAYMFLKENNIPFEFLYFEEEHNTIHKTIDTYWREFYTKDSLGVDGVHADENAHKKFAERIYKCLTE